MIFTFLHTISKNPYGGNKNIEKTMLILVLPVIEPCIFYSGTDTGIDILNSQSIKNNSLHTQGNKHFPRSYSYLWFHIYCILKFNIFIISSIHSTFSD